MVPCRECQHEVSENAPICPNCGAPGPAKAEWLAYALRPKHGRNRLGGMPLRQISDDIQGKNAGGILVPCRECQKEVSQNAFICPQCGAPKPAKQQYDGWGFEYKSKMNIAGLPLVHIAFKFRPNYMPVVARGFIAIGQFAAGVITIAQFGVGIVSVSQIAVGVWAIGQLALASTLIAQIGVYIQSGRGQLVISLAEIIQWLTAAS